MNRMVLFFIISCAFITGCDFRERDFDTLYLRLKKDITTLDPAYIVDVDGGRAAAFLYNGLVRLNYDLEVIPDIAKSWEILDGGLRYRFYLHDDVFFSNGARCTAYHIKKSFERILDPSVMSPRSWIFDKVKGAQQFANGGTEAVAGFVAVDDVTFDIVLEEPFSPFLSILTTTNALVALPIDTSGRTQYCYGTGPFTIDSWERGNRILLAHNQAYFGEQPHISYIELRIIPEDFTAITEFENGKLDILEVPRAEFEYFTENPRFKDNVHSAAILNTYYIGFNCQKYPYSSQEFRRTIASSINREEIISKFLDNTVLLAKSPVPPALLDESVTILETQRYDPDWARGMYKSLNIDEPSLTLYIRSGDRVMEGVAELIQHDLAQTGISITIEGLEWTTFKEKVATGEAGMFILSWWADYPNIENFMYPLFHSSNWGSAGNRTRYANPRVDELIEKARVEVDEQQANRMYEEALTIIMQESPWVCLWHKKQFTVTRPWVYNYKQPSVYTIQKGTEILLKPKGQKE